MAFKKGALAAAAGLMALALGTASGRAEDLPQTHLQVIGSASFSSLYKALEVPFWNDIAKASNGKVTAKLLSQTESGMKTSAIARLLGSGTLQVAWDDLGSVAGDDPYFEGLDLAGVIPDMATFRKAAEAYKPVMAKQFAKHNIKLVALLPFPEQVLFCRGKISSLDDLKGKKIRASTRSESDFIHAAGALPVTLGFPDVIPALQTGVADCAVTGTFPGNTAHWYEVTNTLYTLPFGSVMGFYGFNMPTWNKLDPKVQAFFEKEFADLEQRAWALAEEQTQDGINCDTGVGECKHGTKGHMTLAKPSPADFERAKELAAKVVLPDWASRCGKACVADWNATVGKVAGVTAQAH
ncbi:MAG TPA: TRAP transporter substrate-binding protein [Hyphomicrobiales bacterium]|nr:TRAP transporter substrate-binding protein [Hyphomicrobiales bacterium]